MNNAVAINARIFTSITSFFHNNSGCNPMERKRGYPCKFKGRTYILIILNQFNIMNIGSIKSIHG
jgi:hypothetical protein